MIKRNKRLLAFLIYARVDQSEAQGNDYILRLKDCYNGRVTTLKVNADDTDDTIACKVVNLVKME